MAEIHYFQRYSQQENVVTNNTLLLLSRLHQEEPAVFEQLLSSMLEDEQQEMALEFRCGPQFTQQKGGKGSVPDGVIRQTPFHLVLETKLGHHFSGDQLARHAAALDHDGLRVLLALGKTVPGEERREELSEQVREAPDLKNPDRVQVIFSSFRNLVAEVKDLIPDHRFDLVEIVDDFEAFCDDDGLMPTGSWRMRAVAVGTSHKENVAAGVYFQPEDRGYRDHQWIGLYWNKAVRHVGKVSAVVTGTIRDDKEFIPEEVKHPLKSHQHEPQPALTDKQKDRIVKIHHAVGDQHGWDLSRGHRFFLFEDATDVHFQKKSKYGMLHSKYFDLRNLWNRDEDPATADKVKEILEANTW